MKISGLQKLTLLDYPGKTAALIFTPGCNFRCPFCHNAVLVLDAESVESISEGEVLSYLKKRKGILEGLSVTGGEPLMQKGIKEFLLQVKETGYSVKLDTNGTYPDKLEELIACGAVDYVAMDIKNRPEKYAETAGVELLDLSRISRSKELLLSGSVDYEFRTTVVRELMTPDDVEAAAKWITGAKRYCLQKFKDSGGLIKDGLGAYSDDDMKAMAERVKKHVKEVILRGID